MDPQPFPDLPRVLFQPFEHGVTWCILLITTSTELGTILPARKWKYCVKLFLEGVDNELGYALG